MNNTFLAKAGLTALVLPVFVLFQAPGSPATNELNAVESSGLDMPCANTNEVFPDSIFVRPSHTSNQSVSGFEIHFSYANGLCSKMVYSSMREESMIESFRNPENLDLLIAQN